MIGHVDVKLRTIEMEGNHGESPTAADLGHSKAATFSRHQRILLSDRYGDYACS